MADQDHAAFIAEQYETGAAEAKASRSTSEKWANRVAALLALAEEAAKAGDEAKQDDYLQKASALQLKYAVEDAMLARTGAKSEEIIFADFCRESNTPLIKAKRNLINELAYLNRGKALLMSEWQKCPPSKRYPTGMKLNKRAYIRVYAHEGDLTFISQLYTSLILQMQKFMAADERRGGAASERKTTNAWRVSYAYGWVGRVAARMHEAKRRNEAAEETGAPGTALVLADRKALVDNKIDLMFGKLRSTRARRDDNDPAGRAAGRAAGDRADLGGKKVGGSGTRAIEA
jgi:hypothetical protein